MTKTYEKTFEYKGQMVNYYNKVVANPKVDKCFCGLMGGAYRVVWTYKAKA
jgi:hypothetical protein